MRHRSDVQCGERRKSASHIGKVGLIIVDSVSVIGHCPERSAMRALDAGSGGPWAHTALQIQVPRRVGPLSVFKPHRRTARRWGFVFGNARSLGAAFPGRFAVENPGQELALLIRGLGPPPGLLTSEASSPGGHPAFFPARFVAPTLRGTNLPGAIWAHQAERRVSLESLRYRVRVQVPRLPESVRHALLSRLRICVLPFMSRRCRPLVSVPGLSRERVSRDTPRGPSTAPGRCVPAQSERIPHGLSNMSASLPPATTDDCAVARIRATRAHAARARGVLDATV